MSQTMSAYDRHFARRCIIWRITNVKREAFVQVQTPLFKMRLGDTEIKLRVTATNKLRADFLVVHPSFDASDQKFDRRVTASIIETNGRAEVLPNVEVSKVPYCKGITYNELFDEENRFLNGNELMLEIKIELMEDPKIEKPATGNVLSNFEKLVNNEDHSDFVFICSDGANIYVQKSIIAVQCEAFATMIDAGLSEMKTNSAKVTDIDSETMLELIRYLYCRKVNNIKEIQEKLLIAANKYGIDDLKALCVSSLMESLTYENVPDIYEIADLLGEEHLQENCIDYINCHYREYERFMSSDFSKKLWMSLWKSTNSKSTLLWFLNEKECQNSAN